MTGIGIILKSLGVKFEQEHIVQIEAMIPQVPAILQSGIKTVQEYLDKLEVRQIAIESEVKLLRQIVEGCNIQAERSTSRVLELQSTQAEREEKLIHALGHMLEGFNLRIVEVINESIRSRELQRTDTLGNASSGSDKHARAANGGGGRGKNRGV